MAELERPLSLTALVTDHIRSKIVRGEVPLGSSISERGISTELKVSKTPVREALAQLRNEGLVSIVPQSGVRVFTLSAREVQAICTFRKVTETAALQLAMRENQFSLQRDLERIDFQMQRAMAEGEVRRYLDLDTSFHLAFFAHCGNPYLQSAYGLYSAKIAALRTHLSTKPRHTTMSLAEHGEIVAAVRANQMSSLAAILDAHISRTQDTFEIGVEDISKD